MTTQPLCALDDPLYRLQIQGLIDITAAIDGKPSRPAIFSTDLRFVRAHQLDVQIPVASRRHDLYTDVDENPPKVICDRNGAVVLGLCKRCGKAEIELAGPCVR